MGLIYKGSHVLRIRNSEGAFTSLVTLDGQRTFDSELSEDSENAPQTKVVAETLNDISTRLTNLDTAIKNIGTGSGTGGIPTASDQVLGGVKVGNGIDVDSDGTISLDEQEIIRIMEENFIDFSEEEIKAAFSKLDNPDEEEPTV